VAEVKRPPDSLRAFPPEGEVSSFGRPCGTDTLVVGLGNPILGDDGVGWRVAETIKARLVDPAVDVICLSLGGLALMEHLAGYRRAIIVDAMTTGAQPGSLHSLSAHEMDELSVQHTASVHDLSLSAALAMGRELGLALPEEIRIVGVEAKPEFTFGETLSAAVADSVHRAATAVEAWLHQPATAALSKTQHASG
jgi:hydrogenase maturation protease